MFRKGCGVEGHGEEVYGAELLIATYSLCNVELNVLLFKMGELLT